MTTTRLARFGACMLTLLALSAGLSACDHTIRGVGADARETSDAVNDATR